MSNEATVRSSLQIKVGSLDYASKPTVFNVDVSAASAPTPGRVTATVAGTNVDLTKTENPGLCRIMNLDATNYVEYGIWDPELDTFFPLGEIGPGESYVLKLSLNIQEQFATGTGTTGADTNRLRLRADTASCECIVEVFDR